MKLWNDILSRCAVTEADRERAKLLLDEYRGRGYLAITPAEAVRIPDGVIALFYAALNARAAAPLTLDDASFCFMNVRALGVDDAPGNFLQAAKVLPTIRSRAIHLGPFTEYDFHVIYAVRSVRSISSMLTHHALEHEGFSREAQLAAFVEAAHALGKAVGFDIEPHLAQYSIPGIEQPEIMRWISLDASRRLAGGMSFEAMMREEVQRNIAGTVKELVTSFLAAENLTSFEYAPDDSPQTRARRNECYGRAVRMLIDRGYWTVPGHIWCGLGVPDYAGYNHAGNHPEFSYRARTGELRNEWSFGVTATMAFSHNLRANDAHAATVPNEAARAYFCGIFDYWRDNFDFDFIRYDSVDHIFDSVCDDAYSSPASDRPTPDLLRRAVTQNRVFALAERMGDDVEPYSYCGFDCILGNDMMMRVDAHHMRDSFHLARRLERLNRTGAKRIGAAYAVDTHDTGDPRLWGDSLNHLMGPARMLLRYFVAHFMGTASAPRPVYECAGSQDMSHGLYRSNVNDINMVWVGDAAFNAAYHSLADAARAHHAANADAELLAWHVAERYAWWITGTDERCSVIAVALECAHDYAEVNEISVVLPELFRDTALRIATTVTPLGGADTISCAVNGSVMRIAHLPQFAGVIVSLSRA